MYNHVKNIFKRYLKFEITTQIFRFYNVYPNKKLKYENS